MGPCGTNLCGRVFKGDLGAAAQDPLEDIIVELRDSNGVVVQTAMTAADGLYSFASSPANAYLTVSAGRNQVASPGRRTAAPGNQYHDFTLSGVPARITVTGPPGTFVLITPAGAPFYATPPTIDFRAGTTPPPVYSGAIGLSGQADIRVPRGAYGLTCWEPVETSGQTQYVRAPSSGVMAVPGGVLEPQNDPPAVVACPQPG